MREETQSAGLFSEATATIDSDNTARIAVASQWLSPGEIKKLIKFLKATRKQVKAKYAASV